MIGLQKQIEARKVGIQLDRKEPISYSNIAKILNKPYITAKRTGRLIHSCLNTYRTDMNHAHVSTSMI